MGSYQSHNLTHAEFFQFVDHNKNTINTNDNNQFLQQVNELKHLLDNNYMFCKSCHQKKLTVKYEDTNICSYCLLNR